MNSQCRENKDLIADLVTGIMPQEQAKQVHDHLDTCPSCREYTLTL